MRTATLAALGWVKAHAVPVAPHGALGPLQTIAAAHVALVTPNLYRQEILGPGDVRWQDGCRALVEACYPELMK